MTNFFLILFLALFLIGGGAGLWVAFTSLRTFLRFRSGVVRTTQAKVITSTVTRTNNRDVYHFRYRYTVEVNGEEEAFEEGSSSQTPVREGESLTVEYLEEDPSVSRLEGSTGMTGIVGGMTVGVVCVVVALVLALRLPELLST